MDDSEVISTNRYFSGSNGDDKDLIFSTHRSIVKSVNFKNRKGWPNFRVNFLKFKINISSPP